MRLVVREAEEINIMLHTYVFKLMYLFQWYSEVMQYWLIIRPAVRYIYINR